ncbi:MAG: Smr/MutS family protein [Campylobacterales bacterium]
MEREELIKRLDLEEYLAQLESFFARPKGYSLIGDLKKNFKYLKGLEKYQFSPPPEVPPLDREIIHLKKFGVLNHRQIFDFLQIVEYFHYLKSQQWGELEEWFQQIRIPEPLLQLKRRHYTKEGEVTGFQELEEIDRRLKELEQEIRRELYRYINSRKLENYLVDRQIHLVNREEALLLRGGFHHILKGEIIGRSSSGFFYVIPSTLRKLKEKREQLLSQREEFLYRVARDFSEKLRKWVRFLEYINREFDKFDQLQARVQFGRQKGYSFFLPTPQRLFKLREFCHPALQSCIPLNLEWESQVLIVTGVNAGGKTMLLKSLLTAAFLGKHLLPFQAREGTKIPLFRGIFPIISDPQNTKEDISTFAGRIQEFSHLFREERGLVGVDEIELGTDVNEAAILFKVVVEELMKKHRIVITTHHKRLASLLADNPNVELLAALYDLKNRRPTFQFVKGTIGKSYAFETALRYGLPYQLVQRARREYSADLERLESLIDRSTQLEQELKRKKRELEEEWDRLAREKSQFKLKQREWEVELEREKSRLEREFHRAIEEAKRAFREARREEQFHRHLGRAHQLRKGAVAKFNPKIEKVEGGSLPEWTPAVGDWVQFRNNFGELVEIKGRNGVVEVDGKRITIPLNRLQRAERPGEGRFKVVKPKLNRADLILDLHGKRLEEALEEVEQFLNRAVLAGLEEVIIKHGVGGGVLARGVRELLERHPLVKGFEDAPPQLGGLGAKIVKL